jgi:hypothetical protein
VRTTTDQPACDGPEDSAAIEISVSVEALVRLENDLADLADEALMRQAWS